MMRSLIVTILAAHLPPYAAAEVAIVVPGEYENAEAPFGADSFETGFPDGYRLQFVYDAAVFAALPPSHTTMTGFYLRPDGSRGNANSVTWPDFTLRLSTTAAEPGGLSTEFEENFGPDETVVYEGPITLTTANVGPADGPKEFDIAFEFQTPFTYDPAAGNLLVDWIVQGPAGWVGDDRGFPSPLSSSISSNNYQAQFATDAGSNDGIIQFRFIPEPPSLVLGALAAALSGRRRRR